MLMRASVMAALLGAGAAVHARADLVPVTAMAFGVNFRGGYEPMGLNQGVFSAHAAGEPGFETEALTTLARPFFGLIGQAVFEPGFVSHGSLADFTLTMNIMHDGASATGAGTFLQTDADGDTFGGAYAGIWERTGSGYIRYTGQFTELEFRDNTPLDDSFDGSQSGGFGLRRLLNNRTFSGSFTVVFPDMGFDFFNTPFSDMPTAANAQTEWMVEDIPLPRATGMVMAASACLGLRRSRRGRMMLA